MEIIIRINVDNAAFDDGRCGAELARILRTEIAGPLEQLAREDFAKLRWDDLADVNGNAVGTLRVRR